MSIKKRLLAMNSHEIENYLIKAVVIGFKTGHHFCKDYREFEQNLKDDGIEATYDLYNFYIELVDMGPVGLYEEYKDSYDFDPSFIAEYGYEEDC